MAETYQTGEVIENGAENIAGVNGADMNGADVDDAIASVLEEAASGAEGAPTASVPTGEATAEQLVAQLQGELDAERQRFDELNDRFQRSSAEFQNTLRRREKQTEETIQRASAHVVLKLLPVIDDFERAFQAAPEGSSGALLEGFRQIQKKLSSVLEDEGVTVIPQDGVFDPALHEAISSEPSDTVPSGNIIATLRVGYEQRGRVLRPALVRVAA